MSKNSSAMKFTSAAGAYRAGYDWVFNLLTYGDVATMLVSVEAAYQRSRSNTLVPFIADYWLGQLDHLSGKVSAADDPATHSDA